MGALHWDNFDILTQGEPYYLPKAGNESDLPSTLTDHPAWKRPEEVALGGAFTEQATPSLAAVC